MSWRCRPCPCCARAHQPPFPERQHGPADGGLTRGTGRGAAGSVPSPNPHCTLGLEPACARVSCRDQGCSPNPQPSNGPCRVKMPCRTIRRPACVVIWDMLAMHQARASSKIPRRPQLSPERVSTCAASAVLHGGSARLPAFRRWLALGAGCRLHRRPSGGSHRPSNPVLPTFPACALV